MNPYIKAIRQKRKWTPLAVDRGPLVEGSEKTIYKMLALRNLELPVKEFLQQGLEKDLPDVPGCLEALIHNQMDEDKHDLGFELVCQAHGTDPAAEREAEVIRKAWIEAPEHPILKASILERSVFFVLLPAYRFLGDIGMRSLSADISRDEVQHVKTHAMCAHDLGLKSTVGLDKLRKATVDWVMSDLLPLHQNKYLSKDFWMNQSDSLYTRGLAAGLADTQRSRMPSFFEASNVNLPQYG